MPPRRNVNSNTNLLRLSDVPIGTKVIIEQIAAGFKAATRLSSLGLVPGTVIKKISEAPFYGPVQIEVRGTKLAIGRGLTHKILCRIA
ncbi:MAG: FeoA family protein [Promethearchaeota archaeon]